MTIGRTPDSSRDATTATALAPEPMTAHPSPVFAETVSSPALEFVCTPQ